MHAIEAYKKERPYLWSMVLNKWLILKWPAKFTNYISANQIKFFFTIDSRVSSETYKMEACCQPDGIKLWKGHAKKTSSSVFSTTPNTSQTEFSSMHLYKENS